MKAEYISMLKDITRVWKERYMESIMPFEVGKYKAFHSMERAINLLEQGEYEYFFNLWNIVVNQKEGE